MLLATGLNPLQQQADPTVEPRPFKQQLGELLVDRAFLSEGKVPRSAEEFQQHLASGRKRIGLAVQDLATLIEPLMESLQAARVALESCSNPQCKYAKQDGREQFRHLLAGNFLVETPWEWLIHYPRYFQALQLRIQRLLNAGLARDQRLFAQVEPLWKQYLELARQLKEESKSGGPVEPGYHPKVTLYRWLLEEYRVSLFAQELRTAVPVSEKRLAKLWEEIQGK